MSKKAVYLFSPTSTTVFDGRENVWLPYSVSCVWSYANQFADIKDTFNLNNIFFKHDNHDVILDTLQNPSVVGFSVYAWNEQYCLALAEKIKQKWPLCIILFGGKQVNEHYLKYTFIDTTIINDGEVAFLEILRKINNDEELPKIVKGTVLENLDIPSPYTDGTFDTIVKNNPDTLWLAPIETNRGCPYTCTFCAWSGTPSIYQFPIDKIQKEFDWIENNTVVYAMVSDGNFGIFEERDIALAHKMRKCADNRMLDKFTFCTAKNNNTTVFEIAKILGPFVRGVTVSVQSMNTDTLTAINRNNMKANDIAHSIKLSEEYNIPTYTDLILGLPLETEESWRDGLSQLLELGQHHCIDFFIAEVLENTTFSQEWYKNLYNIQIINVTEYATASTDNYPEISQLVCGTSTMDMNAIIDSYMYAWMIVQFHIIGYTQLYARYVRQIHNIPYRTFYDLLFKKLQNLDNNISGAFEETKDIIKTYLQTGKITTAKRGFDIQYHSHKKLYENKAELFELGYQILVELGIANIDGIHKLQQLLIYDVNTPLQYPKTITVDLDINNWNTKETVYTIQPVVNNVTSYEGLNTWENRVTNPLKNKIVKTSDRNTQ